MKNKEKQVSDLSTADKKTIERIVNVCKQVEHFDLERRKHGGASILAADEAGALLDQQKVKLGHGKFMKWCEQHIPVKHRTINRWIKLHHFIKNADSTCVSNLKACESLNEAYRFMDRCLKPKTPPDLGPEPGGENKQKEGENSDLLSEAMDRADALYSSLLKIKTPEHTAAIRERCQPIMDWLDIAALRSAKVVEATEEPLAEAA